MGVGHEEAGGQIRLPSRRKQREEAEEDEDEEMSVEPSGPLLVGDAREDGDGNLPRSKAWAMLSLRRPWHKSRRRPSVHENDHGIGRRSCGLPKGRRRCALLVVGFLVALGIFQLIILVGNCIILLIPDRLHTILHDWGRPGFIGAGLVHWPTDFTRDIFPKPCHSHNDYWRRVPFFSALEAGCIGVEADIWLFEDELYVGHSISSLTPNRTLDSLYINPLLNVLAKQNQEPSVIPDPNRPLNGVYDTTPEQVLIFLIDFKTSGPELFPYVVKALEPLREKGYLSRRNGSTVVQAPVIVVGTGECPFDMVTSDTANPHQDIFFDAPLDTMFEAPTASGTPQELRDPNGSVETYNTGNSYYASTSFAETIGRLKGGKFSKEQLEKLRGQVAGAHRRGLKARYWELPYWPIHLRNYVWSVLVEEGVDILNVDDLKGATQGDWSKPWSWWYRQL